MAKKKLLAKTDPQRNFMTLIYLYEFLSILVNFTVHLVLCLDIRGRAF